MNLTTDYVAGFIDGEGCFELGVNVTEKANLRYGWRPKVRFSVSQKDEGILTRLQEFFGCGCIDYHKKNRVFYFSVSARNHILQLLIPKFDSMPFVVKKSDYELWREAALLLGPGKTWHTNETYRKYLALREKINPGRGRRRKVKTEDLERRLITNG